MPPKKEESALLADLRVHMEWVEANMHMLQARKGVGLRGKLRQGGGGRESYIYQWLLRFADRIASSFVLSVALDALGARVNNDCNTVTLEGMSACLRETGRKSPEKMSLGGADPKECLRLSKMWPGPSLLGSRVERAILSAVQGGYASAVGLVNLGNTCYINAVFSAYTIPYPFEKRWRVCNLASASWATGCESCSVYVAKVWQCAPT